MQDYFGYDVHFVMNITDLDDKVLFETRHLDISLLEHVLTCVQIILRARQTYLVNQFRSETKTLSPELLDEVRASWVSYVRGKVSKGLRAEDLPENGAEWDAWSSLENKFKDKEWRQDNLKRDEKFEMYFNAAVSSHSLLNGCVERELTRLLVGQSPFSDRGRAGLARFKARGSRCGARAHR